MDLFQSCRPASMQLNHVSWTQPKAQSAFLSALNLEVKAGELLTIVGPNGSGKTSLLRCLYRMNPPDKGEVLLDGKSIWSLSAKQCAQRIATVLQDAGHALGLSVFEMVEIGLTPKSLSWKSSQEDRQIVDKALAALNVLSLKERRFETLSGGEKQRVMIARALAQQPDVLILDEPTNHLDIRHQLEVLELLSQLPCTVIVSLHDLSLAANYADRIVVMQAGNIIDCAPPLEALTEAQIRNVFSVESVAHTQPNKPRPSYSFHLETDKEKA
ncbi:iron ABC transporter ATP-binding protein [Marinomonas sp. TW1]|nr:iron ABC transporter ATP-binding protein [Marinomonas sp. TW1]